MNEPCWMDGCPSSLFWLMSWLKFPETLSCVSGTADFLISSGEPPRAWLTPRGPWLLGFPSVSIAASQGGPLPPGLSLRRLELLTLHPLGW